MLTSDDLAIADRVSVIEGAGFDARKRRNHTQLAAEQDLVAIVDLATALCSWTERPGMDWMEWPAISVVFVRGAEVMVELGLLSGFAWVRTPEDGDRELADSGRVIAWLRERGVEVP